MNIQIIITDIKFSKSRGEHSVNSFSYQIEMNEILFQKQDLKQEILK